MALNKITPSYTAVPESHCTCLQVTIIYRLLWARIAPDHDCIRLWLTGPSWGHNLSSIEISLKSIHSQYTVKRLLNARQRKR